MKLRSLTEVENALSPYFTVACETVGKDITLGRTERLMAHLGDPQKKLRIIHVAGTSGKTSTTNYIAALLHATGKKVGHTVSPHVAGLNERVQINCQPLSEKQFCAYMSEFLPKLEGAPDIPTWFEVLIAFTFWVFTEKEAVDYAVMETGLGGLQDSTNVAARADKLCVLTDIGFDHMHILGDRLGAIAHQKAGIIHENNVTLMYEQDEEVLRVVRYWVSQQEGAELYTFAQNKLEEVYKDGFVDGLPLYQKRNWLLAWAVYRFVCRRDGIRMPSAKAVRNTQKMTVPGRMEVIEIEGKQIVLDGAHNEQKVTAMAKSFRAKFPGVKPVVLMALKEGKELKTIAPILASLASEVIVTQFSEVQDLPFGAMDPHEIAKVLEQYKLRVTAEADTTKALHQFVKKTEDVGLVTGSFFLIAELKKAGLV